MKNIKLFILIFIIFQLSCNAQQVISLTNYDGSNDLKNENYIKDFDGLLEPFIGTWEWTNGNNTVFRIKFVKAIYNKINNSDNYFKDRIFGGYQYILNGVEVVNTLNFTTSFSEENYLILSPLITMLVRPQNTQLHITAMDKVKDKICGATFTIESIKEFAVNARWKLFNTETFRQAGAPPKPIDFSIPTDLILTKIN